MQKEIKTLKDLPKRLQNILLSEGIRTEEDTLSLDFDEMRAKHRFFGERATEDLREIQGKARAKQLIQHMSSGEQEMTRPQAESVVGAYLLDTIRLQAQSIMHLAEVLRKEA